MHETQCLMSNALAEFPDERTVTLTKSLLYD